MNAGGQRLERAGMYLLIMMPVYGFVTRFFLEWQWLGAACLAAACLLACFLSLLPKYLGDYEETEVIRYEGGANRGDDPNPDRESRHETIKQGRRFPLKTPVCAFVVILSGALLAFIPSSAYINESTLFRVGFVALTVLFEAGCMGSISSDFCMWTELPGIGIGFVAYLVNALFFYFTKLGSGTYVTILGVFALIFLFGGFLCLNRASLSSETSAGGEKRRVPKALESRNRRVVIIFAALIAIISFVKPVRNAALWVLRWIVVFFKWLAWLLRGGKAADKGDLERILAMQGFGEEEMLIEEVEEAEESLEQLTSSVWDKVFVYIFLALLAIGVCFIIYQWAMKKIKRDGYLIKRKTKTNAEGYYDEKEELDSEDVRKKYMGLRDRLKNALKRETPWDKLTAREKARRLLKQLYKRKQSSVEHIKSLTAREALSSMKLKDDVAQKMSESYDLARYSEHEIDDNKMDELKKELRL